MPSHCVGDGGYVPCMPTMGSDPAIVFYLVSFQLLCLHLYLYGSKKTLKTSKISVGPTLPLMVKVLASCQRQMLAFPTDCLNFSTANSQKKTKTLNMMPRNNFDFLEFWWISCRPAVSVSLCGSMTGILSPHLLLHRDLLSSVKCFITQLHGRRQITSAFHHCKYTKQRYCLYRSPVVACYFSIHQNLHKSKTGFCFTHPGCEQQLLQVTQLGSVDAWLYFVWVLLGC